MGSKRCFYATVLSSLALVFLSLTVSPIHAIDVNGRIKGTVTDPAGAAVVGAKVAAINIDTGVESDTVTGADGGYVFQQLLVGTYSIKVSATGFKTVTATGMVLNVDQEYVQNVQLTVGSAMQTVMVAASTVQVDTTDMQLSNVVNSEQMVEMPLLGRAYTALELMEPGVQSSSDRFGSYSVSGGETQQESYLVNGADSNEWALNNNLISPNIDAIQQFNLVEGSLNAEYDRNSGGIVSATIKNGTNQFHGDVFEFYRDTFLNTDNFLPAHRGPASRSPSRHTTRTFPVALSAVRFSRTRSSSSAPISAPRKLSLKEMATRIFMPQRWCRPATSLPISTAGNFSSNPIPSTIPYPAAQRRERYGPTLR